MSKTLSEPSRKEVWKMFDEISPTYDSVNRVMSLNLDQRWRRKMSKYLPAHPQLKILDCATGTGDQIIALMEKNPRIISIIGIDLAESMMAIGKQKIATRSYADKVAFQVGSALELPYPDHSFDCVTISFGIRNVTDVDRALREFHRVLKPSGRVLILEGTVPSHPLLRRGHLFYLRHILPRLGALISKNKKAYRYLNETIETFPQGQQFCSLLKDAGFTQIHFHSLFGGAATIYQGNRDALD